MANDANLAATFKRVTGEDLAQKTPPPLPRSRLLASVRRTHAGNRHSQQQVNPWPKPPLDATSDRPALSVAETARGPSRVVLLHGVAARCGTWCLCFSATPVCNCYLITPFGPGRLGQDLSAHLPEGRRGRLVCPQAAARWIAAALVITVGSRQAPSAELTSR